MCIHYCKPIFSVDYHEIRIDDQSHNVNIKHRHYTAYIEVVVDGEKYCCYPSVISIGRLLSFTLVE